ncbi:hypothetical protein [Cumulibacter manganitolerans]|uniref:hypothetical protein n=1 Tax=Cumulibacter manganitolerans TaxID=1884992 RepID=UPI001296D53D|nr:hypothetical protein [Cumulibacter manganitolerans]
MDQKTADAVTVTDRRRAVEKPAGAETATRVGNVVVWTLVALLVAVIGMLLIPLTTPGGVRIPVAPAIALAANIVLPRLMYHGAGWGWATFLPALAWLVVVLAGASVSSDGDLLIPGNSYSSVVGLIHLAAGAMGAVMGVAVARMSPRRRRRARYDVITK